MNNYQHSSFPLELLIPLLWTWDEAQKQCNLFMVTQPVNGGTCIQAQVPMALECKFLTQGSKS